MWNMLPLDIMLSSSGSVFKNKLKTHLYRQRYGSTNRFINFPLKDFLSVTENII